MGNNSNIYNQLPLMRFDSLDYVDGHTYKVDIQRNSESGNMEVEHEIAGNNLISKLIRSKKAIFVTEVSAPHSTYRAIFKYQSNVGHSELQVKQSISWPEDLVVPPVFLRPMVIFDPQGEEENITLGESDGVHKALWDKSVRLFSGAVLATDTFWDSKNFLVSLIRVVKDDSLRDGSIQVVDVNSEGFYFKVKMHKSVFQTIVNPGSNMGYRHAILTFAFSSGLEILKQKYQDNWEEYSTLRSLYQELKNAGLPTWDEEDFHADNVATSFMPLKYGSVSHVEDD